MSRSFTIISAQKADGSKINYTGGRYLSETPRQSVSKMFSKIIGSMSQRAKKANTLKITLRETTSGSLKKEYTYKVSKSNVLTTVERDGQEITYKFITKVKSV